MPGTRAIQQQIEQARRARKGTHAAQPESGLLQLNREKDALAGRAPGIADDDRFRVE